MAYYKSTSAQPERPAITANRAGDFIVTPFKFLVSTTLLTGDVVAFAFLPENHVVADLMIAWPDMDGTAALVYNVGLYEDDATPTVVDADCYISASTAARSTVVERLEDVIGVGIAPVNKRRVVALNITTQGSAITAVTIRGWVASRPASYDD